MNNRIIHKTICMKFIKTETLCSLLNLVSLVSSFALFIIGVRICLKTTKVILIKMKKIIETISSFIIAITSPKILKKNPYK